MISPPIIFITGEIQVKIQDFSSYKNHVMAKHPYGLVRKQLMKKSTIWGNSWQMLSSENNFRVWRGYAFENICLLHTPQILKK